MTVRNILIAAALFFGGSAQAQITIGTNDLPFAGDTFRLSIAAPLAGADYTLTGANYTWDFSLLAPQSQRVDTILPLSATSSLYTVLFSDFILNPYRSNQATQGPDFSLGTISVTGVYNFYYNSSASYRQSGFGASINGIPAPVGYDPKDIIYSFPLDYGDVDTSFSSYEIDQTATIGLFFRVNRTRVNEVDGWGTLITPYGTTNVLRVKTTITEEDSVYYSGLGFGLNLPPFTNIEYKWLGNGEGVPVLQANATGAGAIGQVLYRDNAVFNVGVPLQAAQGEHAVYPNPSVGKISISGLSLYSSMFEVEVYDLNGRSVFQANLENEGNGTAKLDLRSAGLASGNYLLRVNDGGHYFIRPFTLGN